jgi:NAD(P)-dependent dehydrogenase (short-subunit alcohol dehydrogenase family)
MNEAQSKTVLITGCSSGFGRLMVERFLRSGSWTVLATTRHPEQLSDLENKNLTLIPLNVASHSERMQIVEQVEQICSSSLDCLINNAGYGLSGALETLSEDQIRAQFEVNFFTPLLLTKALLPALRAAKGKVINISSVLGFIGMPLQSLYVASKFALEGLSESLSHELSAHNVQVCLIEPGGFRTQFARNIEWPIEASNQVQPGVYEHQMRGYRGFLSRKLEQPGADPQLVAETVFNVVNKGAMPLRVRVGSDTQALYYVRRSLPQKVADRLLRSMSKKLLEVK